MGWEGCFKKKQVIPTIGYTFHGRGGRVEAMKSKKMEYGSKGVMEGHGVLKWSDGGTPEQALRQIPANRINSVAAAGLRHSAPGKSQGRCGRRYRGSGRRDAGGPLVRSGAMAGWDGKRRAEKRVKLGKGGRVVGKWCNFSHMEPASTHLFPHNSTQVVDFPRMYVVSIFRGRANTAEFQAGE